MTTEINPTAPDAPPAALGAVAQPAGEPGTIEKVRFRGPLRKLTISNLITNIGIYMLWGAIPGVLLQLQVEGISPHNYVAQLTVVTTVGAFAAMIAQPIAGLVSDRTRSRFGRRAPWMVAGALIGGLALIGMASANTIVQVAIAWTIVQIAYNFTQGPLSAILPDRVPVLARGTFSAIISIGTMFGAIGGQTVGTVFAKNIPTGYIFLAGFALIVTVAFVLINPDKSNKGEPRAPFNGFTFLKTFWVNPIKYPDFFWGFTGRLLLFTGYFLVSGYQLLILQNYIGLHSHATNYVPLLGGVTLITVIVASLVGGRLSDRIGRRKPVAVVSGVLLAISLLMPLLMPSVTGMVLYAAIAGLGFGAYGSVDQALMSEVLPSQDDFGKDLGVLNIAATLPQTLGFALAGVIVLDFGYAALFPIGLVIAVLGALAVLPIKSVR